MTEHVGVRVGTLDQAERCRRCGGENTLWFAPSPLWNYVMRGNDIDGDWLFGELICVRCFIVLAQEAGLTGAWRVCLDVEPEGLVYTTPSGRTWNADTWMWDEPLYSDPVAGPAEDANRLQAVREVASRRHLYTDLGHYADAVDQALDGPTTQGEDA